jgi:hypothetical protein
LIYINTQGEATMKKLTLALAVLLVTAGASFAADQTDPGANFKSGVIGTVHDVTTGSTLGNVCINCHSTHGGRADAPLLWARAVPAVARSFETYNSASLTPNIRLGNIVKPGTTDLTSPVWGSLICMSCHDDTNLVDESVTIDGDSVTLPGTPGTGVTDATFYVIRNATVPTTNTSGALGNTTFSTTMLKTDHPVNVKYDTTNNPLLDSEANAKTDGVKFYDDTSGDPTVQCGSCHNPHEFNYTVARAPASGSGPGSTWQDRTFFIRNRMSKGQALCLACHK